MKKNKSLLNLIISVASQVLIMIIAFVIPRIIMGAYGSDTNGVMTTVAQIFTYMALLEVGIGKSTKNKLYMPLQQNDNQNVSDILSSAKRIYTRNTIIYLSLVLILSFVLPFVIKSNLSYSTICLIILFEGLTNVVSFYFINCWDCLLVVDGKSYITSSIGFITKILSYSIKITLSLLGVNVVFIQVGYFIVSLIKVILYKFYISKKYPNISWKSNNKDIKFEDNKSYMIAEISWTVFNSTDMIIISIFISTAISSVYSLYNMVYLAFMSIMLIAFNSILYILGNSYAVNTDKFRKNYDVFNSFFIGMMTIFMSVTYWLIIPFVKFYTNGITDVNYIYEWLPLLFGIIQLFIWSRTTSESVIGIAGQIKKIVPFYILEVILNITLSIIFVNIWGIYGVILATVVTLPIKMIACNTIVDKKILNRSTFSTNIILIVNYLIYGITVLLNYWIDLKIDSILMFIVWGFGLTLIYTIIVVLSNLLINSSLRMHVLKIFNKNKQN